MRLFDNRDLIVDFSLINFSLFDGVEWVNLISNNRAKLA